MVRIKLAQGFPFLLWMKTKTNCMTTSSIHSLVSNEFITYFDLLVLTLKCSRLTHEISHSNEQAVQNQIPIIDTEFHLCITN